METARFMARLYNIPADMKKVRILDAGAGSGILSCAFIERLEKIDNVQEIEVTCYEHDSNVLNLLENNLEYCRANANKKITKQNRYKYSYHCQHSFHNYTLYLMILYIK